MKLYTEIIEMTTKEKRELVNITPRVRAAVDKSGFQDGILIVTALHVNCGVFVNDEEPGLLEDISAWANQLAPERDDYKHGRKFESNAAAHLQTLLLNHQATVGFSQGHLELGPWQQIFFAEFDGQRPRRIQVKILGE
ncbi:MAG TPA: secondary thiamine-phosphate synthase enzyme YjbQ [Candidatus Acidoferrales bacterium]|jgi:secondary thiamine-phosphate synthase enzyme|nr:secondary thiamine-phosphate synthase enzyme YjbQ [Candidatus Acidoferrales bacterium]